MRKLLFAVLIVFLPATAIAVQLSGSQTGPNTWTYNVTIDPSDNYDICTSPTTITISGLGGVTAAAGPTSTDFPAGSLTTNNLNWTAQVLNGGTKVVWSNSVGGTGNFGVAKHINGFTITANAPSGTAPFVTNGFSLDNSPTCTIRDASGTVVAPTLAGAVPALSPMALLLMAFTLCAVALTARR